MNNPLANRGPANSNRFFDGLDDMRAWCEEKNANAERVGWKKWLYVDNAKRDDGTTFLAVAELTGGFASEVLDAREGVFLEPMGWDEKRVKGLRKSLLFKLLDRVRRSIGVRRVVGRRTGT